MKAIPDAFHANHVVVYGSINGTEFTSRLAPDVFMISGGGEMDNFIDEFPVKERSTAKLANYSITALDSFPEVKNFPVLEVDKNIFSPPCCNDEVLVVHTPRDLTLMELPGIVKLVSEGSLSFSPDPLVSVLQSIFIVKYPPTPNDFVFVLFFKRWTIAYFQMALLFFL